MRKEEKKKKKKEINTRRKRQTILPDAERTREGLHARGKEEEEERKKIEHCLCVTGDMEFLSPQPVFKDLATAGGRRNK